MMEAQDPNTIRSSVSMKSADKHHVCNLYIGKNVANYAGLMPEKRAIVATDNEHIFVKVADDGDYKIRDLKTRVCITFTIFPGMKYSNLIDAQKISSQEVHHEFLQDGILIDWPK